MQANLPPTDAQLNAPNTTPGAAPPAAIPPAAVPPAPTASADPAGLLAEILAGLGDPSIPLPHAARRSAHAAVPPVDVVNMLTGTTPNGDADAPAGATKASFRELEVAAKLSQSLTERGQLALEVCRLYTSYKNDTGLELLSKERFDSCLEFIDQAIFQPATFDIDGAAAALWGFSNMAPFVAAAASDHFAAPPTGENEDEEDDEDEDEDDMDEDEQA